MSDIRRTRGFSEWPEARDGTSAGLRQHAPDCVRSRDLFAKNLLGLRIAG